MIASRSEESILKEVDKVTQMDDFKGYISDLGGPSGNMYKMKGEVQEICDRCVSPSCIHPVVCYNLDTNHKPMTEMYKTVAANPKVKKAFVTSGLRYDLLIGKDKNDETKNGLNEYTEQLVKHHVSGRLKIAPEHTSDKVLKIMRKPSFKLFYKFKNKFDELNKKYKLNQQLIPYFISGHPDCQLEDMAELAAETKDLGFKLEQVQGFTPTPMTVATVIYYSGYHPYTLKKVYTAKKQKDRSNQNMFFFWYKKQFINSIKDTLNSLNRPDLLKKLMPK